MFEKAEMWISTDSYILSSEAVIQKYSWEKVFWKYAATLQENTHAEVQIQ